MIRAIYGICVVNVNTKLFNLKIPKIRFLFYLYINKQNIYMYDNYCITLFRNLKYYIQFIV